VLLKTVGQDGLDPVDLFLQGLQQRHERGHGVPERVRQLGCGLELVAA
jgi:hypothetical protein